MQRIEKLKRGKGLFYVDNVIDIFYLTGKKVSEGVLLIFPQETLFFVDSRYIDACKLLKGIKVLLNEGGALDAFLKTLPPCTLFVDGKTLSFNRYKQLQEIMKGSTFTVSTEIEKMRAIKDPSEIEKMKKAGALNYQGFQHVVASLKEGITEKEAAWEYEKYCKEKGGESLSFEPIIAFGGNSAYPHYRSQHIPLKKGMNVLIDCGITLDSYTSDMTRTLFFGKEENPEGYKEWKYVHDIVQESYNQAVAQIKLGVCFHTLDEKVQSIAKENHLEGYLRHSLGHGLGLQVHEWPRISYRVKDIPIEEGMVFTIEPGLYKEGFFGVRFENTLLMTEKGVINITKM
jgi:Xaa-Pro aminopeptidase